MAGYTEVIVGICFYSTSKSICFIFYVKSMLRETNITAL
jgi:hypothetical protein